MTYTIIISAHNEEASIPTILASLRGMRERLGLQLYAILVSNGSSDDTYAISLELSQELEWLRVLNNPDGKGWGDGIKFGMGISDPDGFVVTWPADLQFSPEDVERMVRSHTQSEDKGAVFSVRVSRTDGLLNSLRGSVWKWILGKVVSPNCSDPASQLKVFPSNLPFDLDVLPSDFMFDVYFGKYWIESGQPWSEIHVAFGKRRFGQGGSDKFLRSSVSAFSKLLLNQSSMRRGK